MNDDQHSSDGDEFEVPTSVPDPEEGDHVLPPEDLTYPTLSFDEGSVSPETGIDLEAELDRTGVQSVLRDLDDALTSHDLCIEGPDRRAIFGLGPGDVSVHFEPDADQVGRLSIQIDLRAKALTYAESDTPHVGARGGVGFIPKAMLTGEVDPDSARCYNWIDDPTAHLDSESTEE